MSVEVPELQMYWVPDPAETPFADGLTSFHVGCAPAGALDADDADVPYDATCVARDCPYRA